MSWLWVHFWMQKNYASATYNVCVHSELDLRDMTLVQGHDTPFDHREWLCKLSRFNMTVRSLLPWDGFWVCMCCDLESWTWRYDLGSRSWQWWHNLESWTTIVWNIIQIQHGSKEFLAWHGLGYVYTVTFTLIQGHDKLLGYGQQLCKILYIRNISRWEIFAKMTLGRCFKFSVSPILAISRTLIEDV